MYVIKGGEILNHIWNTIANLTFYANLILLLLNCLKHSSISKNNGLNFHSNVLIDHQ